MISSVRSLRALVLVCVLFCVLFFILFHFPGSILHFHESNADFQKPIKIATQIGIAPPIVISQPIGMASPIDIAPPIDTSSQCQSARETLGIQSYIPIHIFNGSFSKNSCSYLDASFVLRDATNMLSQNREDETAFRNLFFNKRNGVFFEMGALDGTKYSNTHFFQKELDWYGILIEPQSSLFGNLLSSRCHNSKNLCLNTAVCSQARPVHFAHAGAVGGIVEFMAPSFMNRFHPDLLQEPSSIAKLPVIPCVPLGTLLKLFRVFHIDWLSLDVEGGELEVIRTIDFNSINIQVLTIETDGSNAPKDKAIIDLLRVNGFRLLEGPAFQGTSNSWFVHNSFVASS